LGKFIPKITNFGNFEGSPNFKSDNGFIWQKSEGLEVAPHAKICRNRLRGNLFGATLYQKITILAISVLVNPHF